MSFQIVINDTNLNGQCMSMGILAIGIRYWYQLLMLDMVAFVLVVTTRGQRPSRSSSTTPTSTVRRKLLLLCAET